jgi:hypothetical protein
MQIITKKNKKKNQTYKLQNKEQKVCDCLVY